jgi:hypothetical protein
VPVQNLHFLTGASVSLSVSLAATFILQGPRLSLTPFSVPTSLRPRRAHSRFKVQQFFPRSTLVVGCWLLDVSGMLIPDPLNGLSI